MRISKIAISLCLALNIVGCARLSSDGSVEQANETYQKYQQITDQAKINEKWWEGYHDSQLNNLVELALKNNINFAQTAINVNRSLYNANLLGANLVPRFSSEGKSSANKGVGSSDNPVSTVHSQISHSLSFNISYTLDLWQRLADTASAAEWEHNATVEDLFSARLALINSVVSIYYRLAYFDNAIKIAEQTTDHYRQIFSVIQRKNQVGLVDNLSVAQAEQAVLSAQNSVLSLKESQKVASQTLNNLLNLKPDESLQLTFPDLLAVKLQEVDMNVPISAIANRPDIKAAKNRLQSSFYNLTAMEKSWFPNITLLGSLSGSSNKVSNITDNGVTSGILSFDLPFLNWNTVKWNVKLSEVAYESAKLTFVQAITTALNEIDGYYYAYNQAKAKYDNIQQKYAQDKKISGYYKNRYDKGVVDLKEWLVAMNTENMSLLDMLDAKYRLLQSENLIYQSMAGQYHQ